MDHNTVTPLAECAKSNQYMSSRSSQLIVAFLCLASAARVAIAEDPACDLHLVPLPPGAKARLGIWREDGNAATRLAPALSPDGKLLASLVGKRVQVWDLAGGQVIQNFESAPHATSIQGLTFKDDNTLLTLADAGYDLVVKFWDPRAGKMLRKLEAHNPHGSGHGNLTRDGKLFVLRAPGNSTPDMHVWDIEAGKELYAEKDELLGPYFSSNGQWLMSCGRPRDPRRDKNMLLILRDARTGKTVRTLEFPNQLTSIGDISTDGKYLLARTIVPHERQDQWRYRLQLLDARSGQLVRTLLEQQFGRQAAFSPDGKLIASEDRTTGTLCVWEVETGRRVWSLPSDWYGWIYPSFSHDGQTLVTANHHGGVAIHDLRTGGTRQLIPSHTSSIQSLAFSTDGKRLASAEGKGDIFVWDLATSALHQRMEMTPVKDNPKRIHVTHAAKMAFAPDGQHLLTQEPDQNVRLFSLSREAEVRPFKAGYVLDFADNGRDLLWAAVPPDVSREPYRLPEFTLGDRNYWLRSAQWIASAWFYPELRQFRRLVYVSPELEKGQDAPKRRTPLQILFEVSGVAAAPVGLSPDGKVLVEWVMRHTGNPSTNRGTYWVRDGLRLSEPSIGREIVQIKPGPDQSAILTVKFAPDSRSLVVGSINFKHDKRRVVLLDARTGKERHRLSEDIGQNGGVAFSPDGGRLAMVNAKSGIDVFDLALGKVVATFPQTDYASVLAFSPDGSQLASGGRMGTILLWDMARAIQRGQHSQP